MWSFNIIVHHYPPTFALSAGQMPFFSKCLSFLAISLVFFVNVSFLFTNVACFTLHWPVSLLLLTSSIRQLSFSAILFILQYYPSPHIYAPFLNFYALFLYSISPLASNACPFLQKMLFFIKVFALFCNLNSLFHEIFGLLSEYDHFLSLTWHIVSLLCLRVRSF